jgi:hypothetical protein
MHKGKPETQTFAASEVSVENPKPDPHDKSISTFKYETDLKRWKKIEALARCEHDEWIYATTHILPVLDEQISCIMDLAECLSTAACNQSLNKRVFKILAAHSERDQRWAEYRSSFAKLPFHRKELLRYNARKGYEAMEK